jgi:hypothetical protein
MVYYSYKFVAHRYYNEANVEFTSIATRVPCPLNVSWLFQPPRGYNDNYYDSTPFEAD